MVHSCKYFKAQQWAIDFAATLGCSHVRTWYTQGGEWAVSYRTFDNMAVHTK